MMLLFLLEEPSARAMLEQLLPRILPPSIIPRFIVFEGKQDLEKQLGKRLRSWQQRDTRFIVLRDQDSGDCYQIKAKLAAICGEAGHPDALIRIVCRELESWYLGDLHAVELGLNLSGLAKKQPSKTFRNPDQLTNPKQILQTITKSRYQQISGSRAIGLHLDPNNNRSTSFQVLLSGIQRLISNGVSS